LVLVCRKYSISAMHHCRYTKVGSREQAGAGQCRAVGRTIA
jgi:hypothetical protein